MFPDFKNTALVLIGYQNDYFAEDGILNPVVQSSLAHFNTLPNTVRLLDRITKTDATIISTPIQFTSEYMEIFQAVGILKTIKDLGAFKKGTDGAKTIPALREYGTEILEIPGKRGLNAFSNTKLDDIFVKKEIDTVIIAGVVSSICIDSTGRDAFEKGYRVIILSDCTCARTIEEQNFYCENIFPVYSEVMSYSDLFPED
ncbi:MAG: cysteine hydrolase [Bacteroidia bacterium]